MTRSFHDFPLRALKRAPSQVPFTWIPDQAWDDPPSIEPGHHLAEIVFASLGGKAADVFLVYRLPFTVPRPCSVSDYISPRFANPAMCSAARNASAMIVIVGCPRPEVTMLEPSHMNRFRTSCER